MTWKTPENDYVFDDNGTLDVRLEGDELLLIRQKKWIAEEIETQVALIHYSGENLLKDPEVEKAKLPPFALAFYKYIFFKSRLPDETEFWNYYVSQHFRAGEDERIQFDRKGVTKSYPAGSVKARLLRSYPSLVRDFHFYVLCQTSQRFEQVRYSLRQDYFGGIDLCVQYKGKEFQVSVMLNSERARIYKARKYDRRSEVPENEVILLFDLYQHTQVKRQIKLFSTKHISLLIEELEERLK